jgi:twitching motility protein PilT
MHSATCTEALSRICMSFPAEIQGSIRAQIADCLVGSVCQRLDFLEEHRIRVPRCEVLTTNSAAKGTIRSGQFSQIANVIQAGGEDGMWTFDRYQRWMAQKNDWVTTPHARSVPQDRRAALPPSTRATSAPQQSPVDTPFEISIDEEIDLAELAKRIDEGRKS